MQNKMWIDYVEKRENEWMNIWLINNYNTLPEHGQFTRSYNFGKNLKAMGQSPVVFVGSHPHNSDVQLIEGPEKFRAFQEEPFPWILVKTAKYGKSRKKQVLTMFQFYRNGKKATKWAAERYGKPDAILGSSAHPLAALLAVRLAKKYHCRSMVEVRDLWPESIVVFGIAGPHNPAVIALRWLEKWLYKNADAVVFTAEGAYDYIKEQGWDKEIPRSKVHYINNGVDLETFRYNQEHFQIEDPDLEDPELFKVVYTGSIRRINNLGLLLDAAKEIRDPRIRLLIWGDGNELPALCRRVEEEHVKNVAFKGRVEKKYIPYILSHADINLEHCQHSDLLKYGTSHNKLLEYLAAGRPIFSTIKPAYSAIEANQCGAEVRGTSVREIAEGIQALAALQPEDLDQMGRNARRAAEEYDFKNLTRKLIDVLEASSSAGKKE